jgi:hypothetical protein
MLGKRIDQVRFKGPWPLDVIGLVMQRQVDAFQGLSLNLPGASVPETMQAVAVFWFRPDTKDLSHPLKPRIA